MMKPVSTEIYPYSTYSLTCWTRLQTSVSPSIFTRSEPDWASICIHQGFSPQKLEGSVAFCYWQSLSSNYTRDGLEFFSCLWLCCLVLSNNKQFHFIMLHHSISRNKITWAAFKQLRTDEDYKYSSLSNWQSQLVQGWGKVHMEEHCYMPVHEILSTSFSIIPVTSPSLLITIVIPSYLPFIIVNFRLFVFRSLFHSLSQIYSTPIMLRASFLDFVAGLSYLNIFTFLWLDN